jgi:thioredoxin-related protein
MLRRFFFLVALASSISFISCKRQVKQTYLQNVSIADGFDHAKAEEKGLILIANKAGCTMCEQFEVDLMKDNAYANDLYKDFIIQRIDENAAGQKWLARILNGGGVPIFLFFNAQKRLMGIKLGAISKSEMLKITENIKLNKVDFDVRYKFGKTHIDNRKLHKYLENLCLAQADWDRYNIGKERNSLKNLKQKLNTTFEIHSSFYNNYLMAKCYLAMNDTLKAKNVAQRALIDQDPASLYFNAELRTELKMILNEKYNVYDDAYIGVNSIEKQLGNLEFGSVKQVVFRIKNLGKKDLIINKVLPDCGCTIANYTKNNISPGKSGNVELTFKAKSPGDFAHTVYLLSNAINGPIQLYIKGVVMGN